MTVTHLLRHLIIAYNHFHPVAEHKKFKENLKLFEKKQLKLEIAERLDKMERRCRLAAGDSAEMARLQQRISMLKSKLS